MLHKFRLCNTKFSFLFFFPIILSFYNYSFLFLTTVVHPTTADRPKLKAFRQNVNCIAFYFFIIIYRIHKICGHVGDKPNF